MDRAAVAHRRLHNLRITSPTLESPEDVLRWLGAVQSQDYPGGKWGIGQRVTGITDATLDQAFAAGKLLRTHVLRPTWHFVLPDDIRWLLELTGPRILATNAHYSRQFGVHDALADGQRVIAKALERGDHLTRKEIQAALHQAGISAHGLGLAYVLMHAELNAVICSGPLRGKQHTYALVEDRAPHAQRLGRDEALATLTRRYFRSHGPATPNDFAWWSSLTVTETRRGLEMLGSEIEHEAIDGQTYWFAPDEPPPRAPSPSLYLLQGYDEYFVGYSGESKAVLDLSNAARSQAQSSSAPTHVIVLDSQVVGRWQRQVDNAAVRIKTELYVPLDANGEAALAAQVDAYGRFLQLVASLVP
jgi:Winged helix DNA-binding domain